CQDITLGLFPSSRIIEPGGSISLELMLMYESTLSLKDWQLTLVNADGDKLQEWEGTIDNPQHRDVLFQEDISLADEGLYEIRAVLNLADGSTRENSVQARVVARTGLQVKEAAVSGPRGAVLASVLQA